MDEDLRKATRELKEARRHLKNALVLSGGRRTSRGYPAPTIAHSLDRIEHVLNMIEESRSRDLPSQMPLP